MSTIAAQDLKFFFGDNLSVRMLGCVVDGTTDDTVNFQKALNSAATTGTALMIPGDAALICSGVTLPSNLILIGRPGAIIRQLPAGATSNTPFITNVTHSGGGNSNITLSGITFDGNASAQTATNVDILSLLNAQNVLLKNCSFQNSVRGQVFGQQLTNITLDSCNFSNWAGGNVGAIYLASRASNNFGGPGGAIEGVSIRGCIVDGRVSHSSCIKLDSDSSNLISNIVIQGNRCYPGDGSGLSSDTLGIEIYSNDPGTSSNFNFTVDANVVTGENATGGRIYGISIGGAGSINGTVTGNTLSNCQAFGIEIIGSYLTVSGNTSNHCGSWSIDSGSVSIFGIVLTNNVILNTYSTGTIIGIHIIAHSTSGPGPYTISDVLIKGNLISSAVSALVNSLIVIESQVAGYDISRVQVEGNHVIGGGTSSGSGCGLGPNTGTCDFVTIRDNYFYNLTTAINIGMTSTNLRFLFNRFLNVTTQYGAAIPSDAIVIDIDSGTPNLNVQSLLIRNQALPTMLPNGDVGLPYETTAFTSQSALNEPNVLCWNGVNFGSALQGAYLSSNTRWAGGGNWTQTSSNVYARAMWVGFGAARFRIDFGPATNANGAEPGAFTAFDVLDPDYGGSNPGGVYTGALCPIFVEGTASAIYAGTGGPNGSSSYGLSTTTGLGSIYFNTAGGTNNTFWVKEGGYGTLNGWVYYGQSLWSIDTNGIETAYNIGVNVASSSGAVSITSKDTIQLNGLTATRPVTTNGSKQLISTLIDLSSADFVQGSGLAAGQILEWDGSKVTGIGTGVTTTITGISSGPLGVNVATGVSGSFVDSISFSPGSSGATLSYTTSSPSVSATANVVQSFGVTTHNVTNGIVTT